MNWITREVVSIFDLINGIQHPECGALCTFTGIVRNHHEGRQVIKLEYTAYEAMANLEMGKLVDEIKSQWPTCQVYAKHRIGELNIGDTAVALAVWAPHRQEAFAACETLINRIKKRVPIWKKEYYADQTQGWVICQHEAQERQQCQHAH